MPGAARRLAAAALLLGTTGSSWSPFGGSDPIDDGITVLAKAEGWSPSLETEGESFGDYFAVVEIAYDAETAATAWAATVPAGLEERSGQPREPGRYGAPDAVDFDEQVLVVYSSGESGACPGWLSDIAVEHGDVLLERGQHVPGNGCTDDYNAYRLLLAVDREKVPAAEELPTERVVVDGRELRGLVATFPAS